MSGYGMLGSLPPGLKGLLAADIRNDQRNQSHLAQAGGRLSIQGAMAQQQEMQEGAPLRRAKMEAELRGLTNPAPKWQVSERFNEETGKKEKVIVDLTNPSNVMPFGGQEARNLSFQNTGGSIVGLDPTTGAQVGSPIGTTATPHQAWQQTVQFPQQQELTRRGQNVTLAGMNRPVFNETLGGFVTPPQVGVGGGSPVPAPRQPQAYNPAVAGAFGMPQPQQSPQPVPRQNPAPQPGQVTPVLGLVPGQGKAPPGYRFTPTGDLEKIKGGPADDKAQSSDVERTSSGYATRMLASGQIIDELEAKGIGTPGMVEAAASTIPFSGKMLSNVAMSPERQQYRQAQEDWVRAKLRKESGAVIADEEMDREIRVYFPQIGDSDVVKKQKADSRRTAQEAMVQASGRATPTRPQRRKDDIFNAADAIIGAQ